MKIWIVSMECAGLAEAGGVKNVTFSLCKELKILKQKVCLFIPVYKCTSWENVKILKENAFSTNIFHCGKDEFVSYTKAVFLDGNFDVVFVNHPSFAEKEGVYTYTEHEQKLNPVHQKGKGHDDILIKDALFAKAVCQYGLIAPSSEIPDVIHCQDASCAMIPVFVSKEKKYSKTKSVVTIHNAGPAYHHEYACMEDAVSITGLTANELKCGINGNSVEPFLLAENAGACLTTVSEQYAQELVDSKNNDITQGLAAIFSEKKVQIKGITNGIDYDRYNPTDKNISKLPYIFNPEKNQLEGKLECRKDFLQLLSSDIDIKDIKKFGYLTELPEKQMIYLAYHGRITSQKGLSVLIDAIPAILNNYEEVRFIINGQGEVSLENNLMELTEKYVGKIIFLNGYNQEIARLTTAACDFIVLPSFFEPCGLEDFIAQIYGTVPVAHKTGGLCKIINNQTGFLYEENNELSLVAKLSEVVAIKKYSPVLMNTIIKTAAVRVHKDHMWSKVVKQQYLKLFKEI